MTSTATATTAPATAEPTALAADPRSSARVGALMAVMSITCVQIGLAVSTSFFSSVGPKGAAWLRLGWAGLLLLVAVRPRRSDFTRSSLLACVSLGVVTSGLTILFMEAVARLPLGTATALEFLGPLGVAATRSRSGSGAKLWPAMAAVGVVLLTEPWHGGADVSGIGYALAAGACWAAYILLTQRVGDQVSGLRGLAVSIPVAALVATAVAAPTVAGHLTWKILLAGLGLAVLVPVIPFALELSALRRLNAGAFGVLMSLEPAVALIVGLVGLHQIPGGGAVAGIVFVVAAGIGAERSGSRTPDQGASRAPSGRRTRADQRSCRNFVGGKSSAAFSSKSTPQPGASDGYR